MEYPLRNVVWDSFNILFSSINIFNRVFKIVVYNLDLQQSSVMGL